MTDRSTRAQRQAALVQAQAPKVPTATERLHELAELRRLKGLIVPPPTLIPEDATKPAHAREEDHRANVRVVLAWLNEVAAKGAGQDVDAAWRHLTGKRLKAELYDQWAGTDQAAGLRQQADRSIHKLTMAAQAEQKAERERWQRTQDVAQLRKRIEAAKKALAVDEKRLAELLAA